MHVFYIPGTVFSSVERIACFDCMNRFIRMKNEAEVDLYVFKWHFGFRVANLWLIIIGGSIINKIDPFIEDPTTIVDLLGVSVPGKSQVRFGRKQEP